MLRRRSTPIDVNFFIINLFNNFNGKFFKLQNTNGLNKKLKFNLNEIGIRETKLPLSNVTNYRMLWLLTFFSQYLNACLFGNTGFLIIFYKNTYRLLRTAHVWVQRKLIDVPQKGRKCAQTRACGMEVCHPFAGG